MILGLSGAFVDPLGEAPRVSTWIQDLGGKIHILLLGIPNAVWPSNCLRIHPITAFLLLIEVALLHCLQFLKQAARS